MADGNRPTHPNPNAGGSTSARPRGGASLSTVRRNLFQSSQNAKGARRPVPASSSSNEAPHFDADIPGSDSSEIVVRDSHGEIELGDPPTPAIEDQDELLVESRQESERMYREPGFLRRKILTTCFREETEASRRGQVLSGYERCCGGSN